PRWRSSSRTSWPTWRMPTSTRGSAMTDVTVGVEQRHDPGSSAGWRLTLRRFRRNRLALVGAVVFLTIVLAVALAGLSPYDPEDIDLRGRFAAPSFAHPFGPDDLGRDILTRVLFGGRISLLVGLLSMTLSVTIGTVIGSLAGYFRGALDSLLMRTTDLFLSLPSLFVLIVTSTLLLGTRFAQAYGGTVMIVVIIGALSWMVVARIVRASFLSIRERTFVEAARANGAG